MGSDCQWDKVSFRGDECILKWHSSDVSMTVIILETIDFGTLKK